MDRTHCDRCDEPTTTRGIRVVELGTLRPDPDPTVWRPAGRLVVKVEVQDEEGTYQNGADLCEACMETLIQQAVPTLLMTSQPVPAKVRRHAAKERP